MYSQACSAYVLCSLVYHQSYSYELLLTIKAIKIDEVVR